MIRDEIIDALEQFGSENPNEAIFCLIGNGDSFARAVKGKAPQIIELLANMCLEDTNIPLVMGQAILTARMYKHESDEHSS